MCYAGKARDAPSRTSFSPTNFHVHTKKAMAFSSQQLLNGQRMLRMPGLSSFSSCSFGRSISFGSFNIESLN